jgi:hypothetical protein
MNKPFQFSMRRMFVAITLFAASAALLRLLYYSDLSYDPQLAILLYFLTCASFGAAVGSIFGRTLIGTVAGVVFAAPLLLLALERMR